MSNSLSATHEHEKRLRLWLLIPTACALMAAACGYFLGVRYAILSAWGEKLHDPLARLGYRMSVDRASWPEGFPPLENDLAAAAKSVAEPEGRMLRLVVALHDLENKGESSLHRAEELCRELAWSRCDKAAVRRMVEVLKQ